MNYFNNSWIFKNKHPTWSTDLKFLGALLYRYVLAMVGYKLAICLISKLKSHLKYYLILASYREGIILIISIKLTNKGKSYKNASLKYVFKLGSEYLIIGH